MDLIEDLLLEEELERLGKLSPEELAEEMRKKGVDPEAGRRVAEEALDKAMATRAVVPAAPLPTATPPTTATKVASLSEARERKRSRAPVFATLAIAAAVLLVIGVTHNPIERQIDAWLHPAPTETPTQTPQNPVPPTHEPTPLEKAAALREEAYANVAKGYMGEALDELNEAADLDPGGNQAQAVLDARATIFEKKPRPPQSKMAPAPWEKPLKKTIVH